MTTPEPDVPDRPVDGHAGDLVSAYVDGELDPATESWVATHLEGCEPCRSAAAHAVAAKELLRRAPAVHAGPVVEGFLARHRAVIRTGTAFVGAAAVALGALALSSAVLHPEVVPDVDGMAAAHVATAESSGRSAGLVAPPAIAGMAVRPVDRVAGHYTAPTALSATGVELERRAVFDGPDLTVVVYGDGRRAVSLFEQPGSLQWDELPAGSLDEIDGRPVWVRDGSPAVLVSEVGDLVVTLVADDPEALSSVFEGLPEKERGSAWERFHDACARFTAAFSAR